MSKVVAKVEGKEITEEDVLHFVEEIGPQVAMQFQSEDGMKQIINEMVNQELLLLDAKDSKMEEEKEFKEVLEHTKNSLLKSYAFTKIIQAENVSEDEVEKFFNEHKDVFAKETVDASHILVDDEETAKKVMEELEAGKSFEDLAKEYSNCPSRDNGGNLGEFPRGAMVKEFEDAAFSMEKGAISEPVKTQFGYHIIKLNDKTDKDNTKLEDVFNEVRTEALRIKQQKAYLNKLDELKAKYNFEIVE